MKELKSKKTGLTQLVSEEEYAKLVNAGTIPMSRFTVTDMRARPLIPSIKIPNEVKPIKNKK